MQVSILGPIRIERDGEVAALGPRLQRLLAALVARRGSVVSSDVLADIVWEGSPPEASDTTLRSYITRLRNALASEEPLLVFRQSGYELLTDDIEIDADRFERDVDDALIAVQTADPRSADMLLERALARWNGRPYGDLGDEDWARPERVRLEERRIEALEARIDIMLGDGRSERAIAAAGELTEEFPLRERPRELLMRAMYVSGRRAEAVRAFREYRELLAEETGLDPSAELAQLESEMLAGELPQTRPAGRVRSYELGEVIGRGAFSVVHRAVQPGVGRDVAVKIIRAELADQPEFVRRFEHEAQLAAAVEHPHVVPLYDFWREPGAAFLAMRWMRGGNLAEIIRSRGPLSREQVVRLLDEVGDGLHAAHRAGVVHRDVRPANLLMDEDGAAYVCDFGIAVPATIGLNDHPVHYAAPELLRGQPTDATADIHSLAVTVWECLTGRLPLGDTTDRVELVGRQLTEPIPSVRATRPDLPAAVDEVLARATSKAASDRHTSVPEFVDEVTAALETSGRRQAARASIARDRPNPYVGLHAFNEADADRFHGRDRLIGELADAVEERRLVAVVGPSGSGKSSVVRAGLLPAIRRGAVPGSERWFITTMFPGRDPVDALETALLRIAVNPPASLRGQLDEDGGLLRAVRRVLPDDDATVLVVIDQFEELFTVVESDAIRDRFLAELAHAIEAPNSPLRVIATLRADHYDAPLRNPAFAQLVTDGTVTVRPMQPDEIERAIVEPARAAGVDVESALVADLVAGVTDRPAALPLLQFALTELYERRVAGAMLLETHQSLGGLTGALAARADRVLDRGDDHDQVLARRVFNRLVTFGDDTAADTRRRAPLGEFGAHERTAWLIDEFATARLLVLDRDDETREPTLEVAHESLLRDWPRLTQWIDEDRADLRVHRIITTAAGEWAASDRDDGVLARGGRLELVNDLAERRPDLLNATERQWIDRSNAAAATEATRQRRQRRRLLVAAAAIVALAVAGAAVALVLRDQSLDNERAAEESAQMAAVNLEQAEANEREAEQNRQVAEDNRALAEESQQVAEASREVAEANQRLAEARELILEAEKALDEDPERAILLGVEAAEQFRSAGQPVPATGTSIIRRGMATNRVVGRFPGGVWVSASADGTTLATSDPAGGVALWDWERLEQTGTLDLPAGINVLETWFEGTEPVTLAFDRSDDLQLFTGGHDGREAEPLAAAIDLNGAWLDPDEALATIGTLSAAGRLRIWTMSPNPDVVNEYDNVTAFELTDDYLIFGDRRPNSFHATVIERTPGSERSIEIAFQPDRVLIDRSGENIAVSNASTGDAAVYDLSSGEAIWSGTDLNLPVVSAFTAGGAAIIASLGGTFVVGPDKGRSELIRVHDSGTTTNAPIPGTRFVAASSQVGQQIVIYRLGPVGGNVRPAIELPVAEPRIMTVAANGNVIAASRNQYAVVDPVTGEIADEGVNPFTGGFDDDAGWTIPFIFGDRNYLAAVDGDSDLRTTAEPRTVWSAPPGWLIRGIDRGARRVVTSIIDGSNTESRIVSLEADGETFRSVSETPLIGLPEPTATAVFSPDSELIMISHAPGSSLYRADGTRAHEIDPSLGTFFVWSFSLDGKLVYSGSTLGHVTVFDVDRLLATSNTREAIVLDIAAHDTRTTAHDLSPDGSMVASMAVGPARIWDFVTGTQVAEFGGDDAEPVITFHPTEPWVYVAQDGVLTTHTLDVDELLEVARESVTRSLTEAECERYLRRACDG